MTKLFCVSSGPTPAAKGKHFTVVWAIARNGKSEAKEFFERLAASEQAKMTALFQRLADHGSITNREQFRQLGQRAKGEAKKLWEFKRFQTRMLGEFRPGRIFAIALGVTKKSDELKSSDVDKAMRILSEFETEGPN
jgi:hypothetical protein